ncbi:MAG: DUF1847 domain-containing protein [Actinomycetes bacterium]
MYTCATCARHACDEGDPLQAPTGCPSLDPESDARLLQYFVDDNERLARSAALVESHGYCRKTRVEETIDFARRRGYERLGIAFCIGLRREAAVLSRVLTANGFTVASVVCKNGGLGKELLRIDDADKVHPGAFEAMCNPIGQARFLEKAGTQLNIMLGLCVGHDSLFIKYSAAPVTVLAAKDRVLGHNPLAALYLADGYYHSKLFPETAAPEEGAGVTG